MLVQLLIVLLVLGFVCWLVGIAPAIDATIKRIMQGVIVFVAILVVLEAFGLLPGGHVGHHAGGLLW
jgi:hypothetical protein